MEEDYFIHVFMPHDNVAEKLRNDEVKFHFVPHIKSRASDAPPPCTPKLSIEDFRLLGASKYSFY